MIVSALSPSHARNSARGDRGGGADSLLTRAQIVRLPDTLSS